MLVALRTRRAVGHLSGYGVPSWGTASGPPDQVLSSLTVGGTSVTVMLAPSRSEATGEPAGSVHPVTPESLGTSPFCWVPSRELCSTGSGRPLGDLRSSSRSRIVSFRGRDSPGSERATPLPTAGASGSLAIRSRRVGLSSKTSRTPMVSARSASVRVTPGNRPSQPCGHGSPVLATHASRERLYSSTRATRSKAISGSSLGRMAGMATRSKELKALLASVAADGSAPSETTTFPRLDRWVAQESVTVDSASSRCGIVEDAHDLSMVTGAPPPGPPMPSGVTVIVGQGDSASARSTRSAEAEAAAQSVAVNGSVAASRSSKPRLGARRVSGASPSVLS